MKKLYDVWWEEIRTGHSQHEATSIARILEMEAEGDLIEDFGNSDEFDENYDCDSGWRIKKIEEIK